MGQKSPWFKFYVDDFLSSEHVRAMSAAEIGAYVMLLVTAWGQEPPATIPDDDARLARWVHMTPEEWAKCRPAVLAAWRDAGNGRLVSPRLQREHEEMLKASRARQEAGKSGASARWQTHSNRIAMPLANACDCHVDSRSQSSDVRPKPKGIPESREPAKTPPAAPFPPKTRWDAGLGWTGIPPERKELWKSAYPACDIDRQLAAMNSWLIANPKKAHKHNWDRFITNWLMRSQDRGGDTKSNGTYYGGSYERPLEETPEEIGARLDAVAKKWGLK